MTGTKKLFMTAAVLIILLFLSEAVLRATNAVPPERPLRDSFVKRGPLFIKGGTYYRTAPGKNLYMPEFFPVKKGGSTVRIFIAGGSSAMGFPLQGVYGPHELLERALMTIYPGRNFEIINAAGFARASYHVADVVAEVAGYEADAVVVMAGHNEFLERRFPTLSGDNAVDRALSRSRTYVFIKGLVLYLSGDFEADVWKPHVVGDMERRVVMADFRENLIAIKGSCKKAGVPLVLVDCPSNIKDYRPFGPSPIPRETMEAVDREISQLGFARAKAMLDGLSEKYPDDAWLKFEYGWALWTESQLSTAGLTSMEELMEGKGRENELVNKAVLYWRKAKDNDGWPVRALTSANDIIEEEALEGAALARFKEKLEAGAVPDGAPGDNAFFDHCHPGVDSQKTLAISIIAALDEAGAVQGLPFGWEEMAKKSWERLADEVPPEAWSASYRRMAIEVGINMDRPRRGLIYADRAIEFAPDNPELVSLKTRLVKRAAEKGPLTGD